jgi:hypothetical protein
MTACLYNIDPQSLFQQPTKSFQTSSSGKSAAGSSRQSEKNASWRVVASDGSMSAFQDKAMSKPSDPIGGITADEHADRTPEKDKTNIEELLNPPQIGVDLSNLNLDESSISAIITSVRAIRDEEPKGSLPGEIAMPTSRTNLKEMFQADKICLVCRSKIEVEAEKPHVSDSTNLPPAIPAAQASSDNVSLGRVVEYWPKTPPKIRSAILALIEATDR